MTRRACTIGPSSAAWLVLAWAPWGLACVGCPLLNPPSPPAVSPANPPGAPNERPERPAGPGTGAAPTSDPATSPGGDGGAGDELPSEPPALPAPAAPPAGPSEVGGQEGAALPISFDDLDLKLPADVVFQRAQLTSRAKELEGKLVRVSGYMFDQVFMSTGIKHFVLMRNTECKFGPGGQADHLIEVEMQGDASARFTQRPLTVTGVLTVRPYTGFDGNTWIVYHLAARRAE